MTTTTHNGRPAAFWTSEQAARHCQDGGFIKTFAVGWDRDRGHYIEWMSLEGVWCPHPWYQEHEPEPVEAAQ